jgi:acyl-[acyl-carrier-protein]-phospholipid O-acyltransferase / long-chain-fatty-acid--[acyl-carrier-protein] ligase
MRGLLSVTGFLPYIAALFLNAFTDLGHKIIIQNTVFMVYDERTQIILTAIVNALILLPTVLLFSPAGYLSDRFPKNVLLRRAAFAAVVLTLGITFSYYQGWFLTAFALTFLLAAQSAFYAPAKYGYIRELGGNEHLSAGNAAVQSITTVAILSGIIVYTLLFEQHVGDLHSSDPSDYVRLAAPLGWLLVLGSLAEWGLLFFIPLHNAAQPKSRFRFSHYLRGAYLRRNLKVIFKQWDIARPILALSIYWGIAQVVLAVFGAYAKMHLGETSVSVVQGVMALTGIGIMVGAFGAAALSKEHILMGLAPLGIGGMALMLFLLPQMGTVAMTAPVFFTFGIFAGLFLVPLNAYIQRHTPHIHLGTVMAGNNFVQTLFMLTGLGLTTLIAYEGADAAFVMWLSAVVAAVTFIYLLRHYALEFLWLLAGMLMRVRYKIVCVGAEHVPVHGPVLLLGNHVSWVDWALVPLSLRRHLRFMMDRRIYEWRWANWLFRLGGAIPVSASASKDAFKEAIGAMEEGASLVIFPEGGITRSGEIEKFYRGFEIIASKSGRGAIIPFYIDGMHGSIWSRTPKRFAAKRTGLRRVVTIVFGSPMPYDSPADTVKGAVIPLKDSIAEQA